jgi:glyoxylase-like metal-dependent hydrolase (beta-lactamase superfamily II)
MLNQVADDLDRLGIPVVAGFSTHPHWDHLLWHPRFGDVPRYASAACARAASEARERGQKMAAESASGIPLELLGLVTPLPADGGPMPGEILEHQAHALLPTSPAPPGDSGTGPSTSPRPSERR